MRRISQVIWRFGLTKPGVVSCLTKPGVVRRFGDLVISLKITKLHYRQITKSLYHQITKYYGIYRGRKIRKIF